MRTAHLFAGAGGGLLADLILGHEPVLAVEWVESCCQSLRDRAAEGWFRQLHVHCGDVREFDFLPWRSRVDCIAAGFPCQDISAAGRGEGISGARSGLVSEVFRAIDAIRPGLVWLENSPQIRTRGRDAVIGALVERGYSWKDGTLAASDVGAGHDRARWWCLAANADGKRQLEQSRNYSKGRGWNWNRFAPAAADSLRSKFTTGSGQPFGPRYEEWSDPANSTEEVAHVVQPGLQKFRWVKTDRQRPRQVALRHEAPSADLMRHRLERAIQRGGLSAADAETIKAAAGYTGAFDWSPPDCGICGVVDGMAIEMDGNSRQARIKAAGNGQVPLAAAAAFLILAGLADGGLNVG